MVQKGGPSWRGEEKDTPSACTHRECGVNGVCGANGVRGVNRVCGANAKAGKAKRPHGAKGRALMAERWAGIWPAFQRN